MNNVVEKYIEKAKKWAKAITNADVESLELNEQETTNLKSLQDGSYEAWRNTHQNKFDEDEVWASIEEQITITKKSKLIQLLNYWPSVAAILVIGLFAYQAYFIYNNYQRKQMEALFTPGQSQAYLEIDNSKRIELGNLDTLILFKKAEVRLAKEKISYKASKEKEQKNEFHKINVPRNGEYYVELSDGTKVWLNSESTLGFNSRFDGKERVVELSGEAYFEVAKNPNKAFIVRTKKMDVRVLGTQFNVKAYADEDYTYATLNEGKVSVNTADQKIDLLPDEQLIFENASGESTKKQVDAAIYSAWMKGKFVFKDERLEDIMLTISRWYDIKVFFKNPKIKEERFSMSLNRYENISKILEYIEMTESVQFEIKDKALLVK